MKQIVLTKGMIAIVDDDDYEWLSKFKWCASESSKAFYAKRRIVINKKATTIFMHVEIMKSSGEHKDSYFVDHINRNTLDNRKENLRLATKRQNQLNKCSIKHTSKYKGVSWEKRRNKWVVRIQTGTKYEHVGYYTDENEAAKAYNASAIKHHGEFALLNEVIQ